MSVSGGISRKTQLNGMDNVNNTLDAIGALAEMLGFFYQKLLDNGFDNDEALELCIAWLKRVA